MRVMMAPLEQRVLEKYRMYLLAAAVINAVNNALGTFLTDMPLTPEKILAAL